MGDGNDRVFGSMSADMIDGGDGNDILNGSSFVPAGTNKPQAELDKDADIIIGGNGHDLIIGMAGDDTIYTGKKDEHKETKPTGMRGDWALGHLGDDTIYGSRGQDFLQGGEGSDIIHGGADDDVILGDGFIRFGSGSALERGVIPDAIVVPKYEYSGYGYGTIAVEDLPGNAIGFTHNAQTDKLIAEYAVSIPSPQSFEWSLSIDKEKGDYVLDTPKGIPLSNDQHLVEKNGAADYLYGGTGNDLIIGQTGDDFLFGEKGNDILWGDDNRDLSVAGNDYLDGGTGSDRYVIERNFGKDFIMNLDTSPNSTDTLRITDGYTPDDFTFKRDGDNLVITEKADSRNEITVHKHFSADYRGAYAIDRIVFDNQTVLDTQAVNALVRQDAALANAANHMVQAMAGFGAGSGATAGNLMQNAANQPLLLAASSV